MSVEWLSSLMFPPEPEPEPSCGVQLLSAAPSLVVQITLAILHATALYFAIDALLNHVIRPWAIKQPWIEQVITLNQKTLSSAFHIDVDRKGSLEAGVTMVIIGLQHGIGGLLCVPAVLGLWPDDLSLVQSLVCHGALVEVGWELQDSAVRAYEIMYGGESGRKKNPPSLCIIMAMHHVMGQCMVIPMNLHFRENAHYHEFVFLLQAAAAIATLLQQYGYTQDVRTEDGLRKVKASVAIVFAVMFYSRGVRFVYLAYQLFGAICEEGSTVLLVLGCLSLCTMSFFNVLFLTDAYKKVSKFLPMTTKTHRADEIAQSHTDAHGAMHRHNAARHFSARTEWTKIRAAFKLHAFKDLKPALDKMKAAANKMKAAADAAGEKTAPARAKSPPPRAKSPLLRAGRSPPPRAKSPASADRAAKSMPARAARSPARRASPSRSSLRSSPAFKKYQ